MHEENFNFLKSKTVEVESGCWEWQAGMHGVGYGSCSAKLGGGNYAHRAMFIASGRELPKGMYVLHKCDNRKCINPDHLFLGTHLDNIKDMHAKGRASGGSMPGEKNPSVKFSDQEIQAIRGAYSAGLQKKVIEQKFQISETHYYRIIKGDSRLTGAIHG